MEKPLKTKAEIDVFSSKLIMSGVGLPENVKIIIELPKKQYNEIVPIDMRNAEDLEYNTHNGTKFYLKLK